MILRDRLKAVTDRFSDRKGDADVVGFTDEILMENLCEWLWFL